MEVENPNTVSEGSLLAGPALHGGVAGGAWRRPEVRVGVVELHHD